VPGRKLFVDLGPLRRSRDFRLIFASQQVSTLGSQLTVVAVPFEVYRITHSSLDVGLVSLGQLVPLILCSLIGGSVADAVDRRKILLVVELLQALMTVGLALDGTRHNPALWPLFVFTALAAGLSGFDRPAYNSSIPVVVTEEADLAAAYALWQVQMQVGVVLGPSLAGLLLGATGVATVFWVDAVTFVVSFAGAVLLRPLPPGEGAARPGLRSVGEGLRFLRGRQAAQGTYLLDINAMVFGMPRALFPALGIGVFHGGAQAVGFLYAAPGAGALVGALTTGWVARIRRQGRAVILAVVVWGASIAAFGLVRSLPIALVLLAVAGWADVVSAVFRNTILQTSIPDRLRGRLSAIQIAVVQGGPRLGDLEAGGVADALGVEFSVVSGGLACILGAGLLAAALPGFRRQRSREVGEPFIDDDLDASGATTP
jgi:predicted MFS family arabinose efflux permease